MPKFGDVLKSLAEKAGIQITDETLKKILSFAEISQTDLPDEFAHALENNLLTPQSAIANTDVRSKLAAEFLGSFDSELDKVPRDFEFGEDITSKYKSIQRNTKDKFKVVLEGLKGKLEDAKQKVKEDKNDPAAKMEVQVLKDQIAQLNQKIADTQKLHEVELGNLNERHITERKTFALISALAGMKLPENGLPAKVNQLTAKTLIESDMASKGLQVVFNAAGEPAIKETKEGGVLVDYYVNQKPVSYSDYLSGVLATNKFVQVSNANASTQNQQPSATTSPNGNVNPANQAAAQQLREQAKQLMTGAIV